MANGDDTYGMRPVRAAERVPCRALRCQCTRYADSFHGSVMYEQMARGRYLLIASPSDMRSLFTARGQVLLKACAYSRERHVFGDIFCCRVDKAGGGNDACNWLEVRTSQRETFGARCLSARGSHAQVVNRLHSTRRVRYDWFEFVTGGHGLVRCSKSGPMRMSAIFVFTAPFCISLCVGTARHNRKGFSYQLAPLGRTTWTEPWPKLPTTSDANSTGSGGGNRARRRALSWYWTGAPGTCSWGKSAWN